MKTSFSKIPLSFEQQAELLIKRGLKCSNKKQLIESLQHYNYYRLSGYCLQFEEKRHKFLSDIQFENLAEIYNFDRNLRRVLMEALELIEIQFRTSVAYHLSTKYGPFAHEYKRCLYFDNKIDFKEWKQNIHSNARDSKEIFIEHFKIKYKEFPKLPIWMLVEILSFGSLSFLFSHITRTSL